jgi:hypothetical protein
LKENNRISPAFFAALLLCSLQVTLWAGHPKLQTTVPDGWPTRLDKRKLYPSKYGFIYAARKSAVVEVNKLIGTVFKELGKNNKDKTATGLIIVMDTKEKPFLDLEKIIKIAQAADKQQQNGQSKDALKSVIEAKEKIEEQGMDMDVVLSILPIPIEPNAVPEIVNEFPKSLEQQTDFCALVPTESNIRSGMKKMLKSAMKKQKLGIAKRIVMLPLMPLIEKKIVDGMKKSRQLILYSMLVDEQEGLTEKEKKDKIEGYKKKLGLGENADSDSKAHNTQKTKETSDTAR